MFDMDGTLLDLAFDDLIWNQKLPERYAQFHQCTIEQSQNELYHFYQTHKHTLSWYSTQFWTSKVGVDTLELQKEFKAHIQPRPGCFELLDSLEQLGYECWLVTNADQEGLKLKLDQINIRSYFKVIISSEEIGHAKEFIEFWQKLHQRHAFDPENCYLVDDTAVVLKGAATFGIQNLITIQQPSSNTPAREISTLEYPALKHLTDLLSFLPYTSAHKDTNVKTA